MKELLLGIGWWVGTKKLELKSDSMQIFLAEMLGIENDEMKENK